MQDNGIHLSISLSILSYTSSIWSAEVTVFGLRELKLHVRQGGLMVVYFDLEHIFDPTYPCLLIDEVHCIFA